MYFISSWRAAATSCGLSQPPLTSSQVSSSTLVDSRSSPDGSGASWPSGLCIRQLSSPTALSHLALLAFRVCSLMLARISLFTSSLFLRLSSARSCSLRPSQMATQSPSGYSCAWRARPFTRCTCRCPPEHLADTRSATFALFVRKPVGFFTSAGPSLSTCHMPCAHMLPTTLLTPGMLARRIMHGSLQDEAPAGCSWRK